MKLRNVLVGAVAVGAAALLASNALSQNATQPDKKPPAPKQPDKPAMSPEMQSEMDAWMKLGATGPEHKKLDPLVGTWDCEVKHWMGPGEPQTSKGKMVSKWEHGGRYLVSQFQGDMMGQPFTGTGIAGYSNADKKYVGFWIDSWSTGFMTSEGTCDAAGKVFTYQAQMTGPDGKPAKMREVVTITGPDSNKMEMWETPKGAPAEVKVMEITYTRVK